MKEKELDELLDLSEDYQLNDQVNKKIKKGMIKNINIRILKVLICVALLIVVIWFGIPKLEKTVYYNPKNETGITMAENTNGEKNEYGSFHVLVQTYVGLNFPGLTYISGEEEDNGNGDYTIYAKLHESANKLYMDGIYNSTWKISKSKCDIITDEKHLLSRISSEYKAISNGNIAYYELSKETIQDIKELPDSASLNVSISFNDIKSGNDVLEFIKKYDSSFFSWVALKGENYDSIAEGMSLWQSTFPDLTKEAKEKYPNLYLPNHDEITEEILLQNYLSTLQLLIDHEDFLKIMGMEMLNCTPKLLQKRYDNAKKSGIQAIGIRGWVKKKDLLQMIDIDGLDNIGIKDVKLSKLQE